MTSAPPALERRLALAFAPLDKRAMGLALGIVLALALSIITGLSLIVDRGQQFPLALLGEYFVGYRVSLAGLPIGALWMFVTGFVWGWFLAFCRNLVLAIWILVVRVRADVDASRTFLDHI
jgi:formate hydrogenlyase subunit 3/multisubunit Na+/H+ antiporter MnhD subunit